MSTETSFRPFAFPEVDAPPAVASQPAPAAVAAGPITLMAFPELPTPETGEAMERARVQGHAAGYAAGRRAALATLDADRAVLRDEHERELLQLRTAVESLRAAAGVLNAGTVSALEAAEESVLAAAIEIAAAVLAREPVDTEESALGAVRRALDAAGAAPVHTVRLHPADLALVHDAVVHEPGVRFVADAAVRRGDAVAHLADGVVDAGVDAALERVRLAFAADAA